MKDKRPRPYVGRAYQLERGISALEGWAFGPWLQFGTSMYGTQLYAQLHTHVEVEGFRNLPELDQFAKDLNTAMAPVITAYAQTLRRELAIECAKVAQKAMSPAEGEPA